MRAKPTIKKKHRGSSFDSFLKEEGIQSQVERLATKRACAIQLAQAIEQSGLSKSEVARRMHTSRAVLDRLLDETNPSVTLTTLEKAAIALGRKLHVEIVEG
ncbi:MAG TPA: helix-turn-helix transcriptional regulator [Blastocatellia bacterium]|nr:helix-turn-helix transcriptional regulator [Blastocatellia bacterium]